MCHEVGSGVTAGQLCVMSTRGKNQLFAKFSAMATALRMAVDLLTVS